MRLHDSIRQRKEKSLDAAAALGLSDYNCKSMPVAEPSFFTSFLLQAEANFLPCQEIAFKMLTVTFYAYFSFFSYTAKLIAKA